MDVLQYATKRQMGYDPRYRNSKKSEKLSMDFMMKNLSTTKEDMDCLRILGMRVPPFSCQYCTVPGAEDLLAVSNEDGYIFLLKSNSKRGNRCSLYWSAHSNAIFDVRWVPGLPRLISASGDNTVILWDVHYKQKLAIFMGHEGTVRCIDVSPVQSVVFATGSRDGTVRLWDTRCNKRGTYISPEAVISMASPDPLAKANPKRAVAAHVRNIHRASVTSVAFQDEHTLFAAGVTDGVIKVWDLRKTYAPYKKQPLPKYELSHCGPNSYGFISMVFDSFHEYLYASCTDHTIYCYDCHLHNPQQVRSYTGFKANSYFVKLAINCNDEYLLSGSSDEKAYIWKVAQPGAPIVLLPGHTDEVTSVAWSPVDPAKAVTCADDANVLLWEFDNEPERRYPKYFKFIYAEPSTGPDLKKVGIENNGQPESKFLASANLLNSEQKASFSHTLSVKRQKMSDSLEPITKWFSSSVPRQPDVPEDHVMTLSESVHDTSIHVQNGNKPTEINVVFSDCSDDSCDVLSPNRNRWGNSASTSAQNQIPWDLDDGATDYDNVGSYDGSSHWFKPKSILISHEKENLSFEQNTLLEGSSKKSAPVQVPCSVDTKSSQLGKSTVPKNRKISSQRKNRKNKEENRSEKAITNYFPPMSSTSTQDPPVSSTSTQD